MPRLSDVLGEYVQTEGREVRYYCRICGNKSLLVNGSSYVWFCHVCAQGGRYDPRENMLDSEITTEYLHSKPRVKHPCSTIEELLSHHQYEGWQVPTKDFKPRNIPLDLLIAVNARVKSTKEAEYLLLPMLGTSDDVVGFQFYKHDPRYGGDYVTHGERGLCRYGNGSRLVVFEGMFDFLSIAKLFVPNEYDYTFLFLAGNTPSVSQLEWLLFCADSFNEITLAFDNDKVYPPIQLMHRLRLYSNTSVRLLPPIDIVGDKSCKDWDDVVQVDSALAIHAFTGE